MLFCRRLVKWFLDIQIVIIVICVSVTSYLGWFPIDKQGFFCGDKTIRYRFRGDTISFWVLLLVSIALPIIVILFVEFWRHLPLVQTPIASINEHPAKSSLSNVDQEISQNEIVAVDRQFYSYWRCCASIYGTYFFGGICILALVEFLKIAVGELRPHFLDTCKPDFSNINCSQGYITEYTCTGTVPEYRLMDAYKSFPSGHAAISAFMSLFLCFYVHKQVFPYPTYLSSSMIQVMLMFWAIYCSMSRIIDRRHHWWDVMVGLLIGCIVGCYSAFTWLSTRPPICHRQSPKPSNSRMSLTPKHRRRLSSLERRQVDYGSCDNSVGGDTKVTVNTNVEVTPPPETDSLQRINHVNA